MMREIGVQPHEAAIAGVVDAGDGIPGRRRRLAIDAQIPLAATFDDGVTHVDRDILALPAAQFPDMRGRKSSRRDAGLRRGRDAKRRRQLRFLSRQRDGIERGRFAAGQRPEIGQNFAGRLHGRSLEDAAQLYHCRHHPRKRMIQYSRAAGNRPRSRGVLDTRLRGYDD